MRRLERAVLSVAEIDRAAKKGSPMQPKGWASTYGNVDRMGRIMKPGAFGSTLGGAAHGGKEFASFTVPLLAYHDDTKPVGSSRMLPQKTVGMRHESQLANTDFAGDMAALIEAGAIPATSIGWFDAVWTPNADGNREYSYIDIVENTLCPCPANPLAVLEAASLGATGAAPVWEIDLPEWVKELWPDFARAMLREPETITLSRAAAEDEHTHAKVGGGKKTHSHEDAAPGHAHEGLLPVPEASAVKSTAAGKRHSDADQGHIQTAHDALVMAGAECDPENGETSWVLAREKAATWTAKFVNDLPDSSFALVQSGGTKDDDGKTTPRSLRRLPYKDENGKVDLPHLRNALARVEQVKGLSDDEKAKAKKVLLTAAKDNGVETEDAAMLIHAGRERAAVQGSYEEMQDLLSQALRAAYPQQYPWIRATYPDSVVYEIDGAIGPGAPAGTYRVAYTIDDDGDIEFGVPEEVQLTQVVVPMPEDNDDDRLVASLQIEALALEAEGLAVG